jgi:hypothetical protein
MDHKEKIRQALDLMINDDEESKQKSKELMADVFKEKFRNKIVGSQKSNQSQE